MGFGLLFIGSFLLLNISYFGYTDAIAAVLCALAMQKLARWNTPFRICFILTDVFLVFSLAELSAVALPLFAVEVPETLIGAFGAARALLIGGVCVLFALGLYRLCLEVDLGKLANSALGFLPAAGASALLRAVFEWPGLFDGASVKDSALIGTAVLLVSLAVQVWFLILIYRAYANICMPEDVEMKTKPSKIGVLNKIDEHFEKKGRELAEYKQNRFLSKKQQKKQKSKRK